MDAEGADAALARGYAGRLATTGPDGWPYVVPLLYVWHDGIVYVHNSRADGHLSRNIGAGCRTCFLVDEPGSVYGYGRFDCDTSLSYSSVMVFGSVERVTSEEAKVSFCDELMRKYGSRIEGRPAHVYPRLGDISVYALRPERISGKRIPLPARSAQWPAIDRTRSPMVPGASERRDARGDGSEQSRAALTGSCMCGHVRYEIDQPPLAMYHCHCSVCRAASGAGFATNIAVAASSFRVIAGSEALQAHVSSVGKRRHFCGRCGSPIYSHAEATSHLVSVRTGTLHQDPGITPRFHTHVDSKAPWTVISDGLPQHPNEYTDQ